MSEEASFHEGYKRAMEDVSRIVQQMRDGHATELADLLEELDRRIERARCLGRSQMASSASGKLGY